MVSVEEENINLVTPTYRNDENHLFNPYGSMNERPTTNPSFFWTDELLCLFTNKNKSVQFGAVKDQASSANQSVQVNVQRVENNVKGADEIASCSMTIPAEYDVCPKSSNESMKKKEKCKKKKSSFEFLLSDANLYLKTTQKFLGGLSNDDICILLEKHKIDSSLTNISSASTWCNIISLREIPKKNNSNSILSSKFLIISIGNFCNSNQSSSNLFITQETFNRGATMIDNLNYKLSKARYLILLGFTKQKVNFSGSRFSFLIPKISQNISEKRNQFFNYENSILKNFDNNHYIIEFHIFMKKIPPKIPLKIPNYHRKFVVDFGLPYEFTYHDILKNKLIVKHLNQIFYLGATKIVKRIQKYIILSRYHFAQI